jgi:hypothetical protein
MSLATIAAQLLNEAGVTADDILSEAGIDREGAVKQLAERLGVDLVTAPAAEAVEVTNEDAAKVREGLAILNRTFG